VDIVIFIISAAITVAALFLIRPPSWWGKHVALFLITVSAAQVFLALAFHDIVVWPCQATSNWHTVTTSVGTYQTAYKDNTEWCLWIRGQFPPGMPNPDYSPQKP
jgi:hypothetical protein